MANRNDESFSPSPDRTNTVDRDVRVLIDGSCHCGGVRLSIAETPPWLTLCDCSVCRRLAPLWGHVEAENVEIECIVPTREYVWGDRLITFHACAVCGCTTHWTDRDPERFTRMGVNFRMCDPDVVARFRVRTRDGAGDGEFTS